MKIKHAIVLLIVGIICTLLGMLYKLESWANASELLWGGIGLAGIGLVALLYKLIQQPSVKDFLNK